jgi:hypothetical protein
LVSVADRQSSAWQKVILDVNHEECVHKSCQLLVVSFQQKRANLPAKGRTPIPDKIFPSHPQTFLNTTSCFPFAYVSLLLRASCINLDLISYRPSSKPTG